LETERILGAVIIPGRCWGSNVCEDTGLGACQLCVDLCPEVFAKPIVNFTAFVRPDADLAPYEDKIRQVALCCPVEAIEVTQQALNQPPEAVS
jgi:hypothetical protein